MGGAFGATPDDASGAAATAAVGTGGSTGLDGLGIEATVAAEAGAAVPARPTDDSAGQSGATTGQTGAAVAGASPADPNGVTTATSVQAPGANAPVTGAQPAAAAPTSSPVVAQVAPTVARVVTRGDGEHRMMLKLHPADLGEIHLTVTVRGEHVDVEIAAGSAARDLLRDGAGQLRSLLDSIGRTSGQLVLRDLPTSPIGTPSPSPGGPAADGQSATSYADPGDGRRDGTGTSDQHRRPQLFDEPLDRPLGAPRASRATTVPGGPALDVTV